MSLRLKRFKEFALRVGFYINDYTINQYGDYPNDPMTDYDTRKYVKEIQRHVNMLEGGRRSFMQDLGSCLRIAHYACELWYHRSSLQEEGGDTVADN